MTGRLLVTGGAGQLGREATTTFRDAGWTVTALGSAECDIARPGAVADALERHRPDALLNCAAWTNVARAEQESESARRVNTEGADRVAQACGAADVFLCHISSDYVFDGTAGRPLDETATPGPLNVYGATKLHGEDAIRTQVSRHAIVRTSWLYGQDGPNFVLTMLRRGEDDSPLAVVNDQYGAPTWTGHLASALVILVSGSLTGTFHLTSGGSTTWFDFAEAIFVEAGIHRTVTPITTEQSGLSLVRPRYSVLDNRAWRERGQEPLPPWRDGLRSYINARRGTAGRSSSSP